MTSRIIAALLVLSMGFGSAIGADTSIKPGPQQPTHADISFGPHPHQLLDIDLPSQGEGPFPSLLWFGSIWKPAKHPANLGFFGKQGTAVIAVQTRTMEDAVHAGKKEPASFVQRDAIRVVHCSGITLPNGVSMGGNWQPSAALKGHSQPSSLAVRATGKMPQLTIRLNVHRHS